MRVLLVHNNYSVTGGAEVFFHEIARLLEQNGHVVAKFSCAEEDCDAPYANLFPKTSNYNEGTLLAKTARIPSVVYNHEAKAGFELVISEFNPDIVHCFAIYGKLTPSILDAAGQNKIPCVISCNDYKHICPNYKLYHHGRLCEDCSTGKFYNAILNRCCHNSIAISTVAAIEAYAHETLDIWRKNIDRFLFASRFMQQKTLEFWGEDSIKTDILRNPFDAVRNYVEPHVGNNILYFGRLIDEKGLRPLLDAASACPDVPIVIVGDGPDRQIVEAIVKNSPNIKFVGPAWGEELKKRLHSARAVVVPSLWHENFPYVILQAFAAGKPVIGSRRGGIPELLEAGPHGWLFEPTNIAEFADVLTQVAETPDGEILRMGRQAQRYVSDAFNDDAIYAELIRIYTEVLS